jgi:XisH protein
MAKDKYHYQVKEALEKEGWTITHDPFFIRLGKRKGYIDLGAEILGAERGLEKIAVEIKSFSGVSDVDEFGQFLLYKLALTKKEPDRMLYLAMPRDFYNDLFDDAFFLEVLKIYQVHVIIYDYKNKIIEQWIN